MTPINIAEQSAKDMITAKENLSFDVETVRDYLFGGRTNWKTHKKIEDILKSDPAFDKSQRNFIGRVEAYERALAITNRLVELQRVHGWSKQERGQAAFILSEVLPITSHDVAFEPVFLGQASPAMMSEYWDLVSNKGIQGCYLQTELGHGSNVAYLETTATYIPETHEFDIHSPTLTSTKWWIGGLGKTVTHGIVQAQLNLPGGENAGPHLFLVQLRSLEDHTTLPGISIGDIGPKACGGLAALDNGYARFNHVRIPRTNMFSKFAGVTEDGRYIRPRNPKHSFGGMMYIRASMVTAGGWTLARAITIAIRYTTVRRQGECDEHGLERQVIRYPSTYYRLLPILARAYVFIALGRQTLKEFTTITERSARGDFTKLSEAHAILCGLKVLVTNAVVRDLETARRALGGHGYSAFAGIGRLYADYLPAVTYEGDNFVLDGQVVRAAMKSYHAFMSTPSSPLGLHSSYIRLLKGNDPKPVLKEPTTTTIWQNSNSIVHLLEWRAALVLSEVVRHVDDLDANANQRLSKAVTDAFVAVKIGEMITGLDVLPRREGDVIRALYHLYLLTTVEDALVDLFSTGLLQQSQSESGDRQLRLAIKQQCSRLLPDAIGLTDAFSFSDWALDSALGVSDGRVYEEIWRRAQLEPLNQLGNTPGYYESLRPMLQEGQRLTKRVNSRL
ncbi:acyl-CoA dehydrogenase/oxidase C-terminal [Pisolithus microcarpus]|nr:acyl-CoA dehydrogenase/oxidase C-terminal [Pisolithus microcarpus]